MLSNLNIYVYFPLVIFSICVLLYVINIGWKRQGSSLLILGSITAVLFSIIALARRMQIEGIWTISSFPEIILTIQYILSLITLLSWFLFLYTTNHGIYRKRALWFAATILSFIILIKIIYYLAT